VTISLTGNSTSTLVAGILLLSRSRSFGQRFDVAIVGDPDDIATVEGPALLWSPVLASCGVGSRRTGARVVVPGPSSAPLACSLTPDGLDSWFLLDRAGTGVHPATQAAVALFRDPRRSASNLAQQLRHGLQALGCVLEPAVLDLLFAAPAPPLLRLELALRAGRTLGDHRSTPVTDRLRPPDGPLPDPLPSPCRVEDLAAAHGDGQLAALLDRFHPRERAAMAEWSNAVWDLSPDFRPLVAALAEVVSHVAALPSQVLLPPLSPPLDGIAVGLGPALAAQGDRACASRMLLEMYRFLGGRFTDSARFPLTLDSSPPPAGRLERWSWLCQMARSAADRADALWKNATDPLQ